MSTNDTKISDFTNVLKQFYALIKDTLLSGYITEDELSQKGYLTGDSEAVREKAKQTELDTHTSNSTIHITSEERTKWNGAVTDKHTHSNKSVLDATTASYTTEEKEKLKGIEEGAKANVQSDWNVADPTSDAYVKNKPTIPTKTSQLMNDSYFAYNSVVGVSTEYGATNIGYSYYDVDSKSSGGEVGLPNLRQALQEASETIAENMAKIDESIPEAPSTMTGATAAADGTSGLVPAPLKGDQNKFLRADGTWVAPPESGGGNAGALSACFAYAVCEDAGSVAAKTATIQNDPNWELKVGSVVAVKYCNHNSAIRAYVTLNINDTGAKQIFYSNRTLADFTGHDSAIGSLDNMIVVYMYDGTYWAYVGHGEDHDTVYSSVIGATDYSSGTKGLVPKPYAGDNAKFLRGDATWAEIDMSNVPARTRYTVGNATAADSILITDNGIITLRVYKISNDQLMAVNQYVYVSDTYGSDSTFVGKLAANTGALSNTYGTIAVNAAGKAVKVATVKGYRIEITVMDCV